LHLRLVVKLVRGDVALGQGLLSLQRCLSENQCCATLFDLSFSLSNFFRSIPRFQSIEKRLLRAKLGFRQGNCVNKVFSLKGRDCIPGINAITFVSRHSFEPACDPEAQIHLAHVNIAIKFQVGWVIRFRAIKPPKQDHHR
jgi:hypothetical protein